MARSREPRLVLAPPAGGRQTREAPTGFASASSTAARSASRAAMPGSPAAPAAPALALVHAAPAARQAGPSAGGVSAVVQRTTDVPTGAIQRAQEPEGTSGEAQADNLPDSQGSELTHTDMARLADEVFDILRWRLAAERERLMGWG